MKLVARFNTSIEDKTKRYNELKKIPYPSDQELDELAMLRDEIQIVNQEEIEDKQIKQIPKAPEPKQYKGVISGKIEKWWSERKEKNKATPDMLRQLELEARKEELKARIARAKSKQKQNKTSKLNFSIPGKIFTESGEKEYASLKRALGTSDKDYSALGM